MVARMFAINLPISYNRLTKCVLSAAASPSLSVTPSSGRNIIAASPLLLQFASPPLIGPASKAVLSTPHHTIRCIMTRREFPLSAPSGNRLPGRLCPITTDIPDFTWTRNERRPKDQRTIGNRIKTATYSISKQWMWWVVGQLHALTNTHRQRGQSDGMQRKTNCRGFRWPCGLFLRVTTLRTNKSSAGIQAVSLTDR